MLSLKKRKRKEKKTLLLELATIKQTEAATTYNSLCFAIQKEMLSYNSLNDQ